MKYILIIAAITTMGGLCAQPSSMACVVDKDIGINHSVINFHQICDPDYVAPEVLVTYSISNYNLVFNDAQDVNPTDIEYPKTIFDRKADIRKVNMDYRIRDKKQMIKRHYRNKQPFSWRC